MALTLSKTLIATGQTVQASQITQSIDALTGAVAYDITISGSLTLAGASILNLGTSSVAQQFVSFNPEGTATRTIEGTAFNGGEIAADNPVNNWLLIQYTDENNTLQNGYIPILHA
jgi:hypothetical protein